MDKISVIIFGVEIYRQITDNGDLGYYIPFPVRSSPYRQTGQDHHDL